MLLVRDAINAVQRNLTALAIFVAFALGWNLFSHGIEFVLRDMDKDSLFHAAGVLANFGVGLFYIAAVSAVQAIVFSMMGREIDRPLWKVSNNREAITRFYPLWFSINLIGLTLQVFVDLASRDIANRPIAFGIVLFIIAFSVIATPIGACVMFQGRFSWEHFSESLTPLVKHGNMTLTVLGLTLCQTLLYLYFVMTSAQQEAGIFSMAELGVTGAAAIINSYLECVVFAAVWIICIVDRNTIDEVDLDF